ncbi:hypothetical protein GCM10027592_59190 [Spirosoma flavus]
MKQDVPITFISKISQRSTTRLFLTGLLLTLVSALQLTQAQIITQRFAPGSQLIPTSPINSFSLPDVDVASYLAADIQRSKADGPYRFGANIPVNINLLQVAGVSITSTNRIYRYEIYGKGAYSINLIFDQFQLIPGAELYLYDPKVTMRIGPITQQQNAQGSEFWTDLIQGDRMILELREPLNAPSASQIHLRSVVHGYRDVFKVQANLNESGSCNVNMACFPDYQPSGDGVVILLAQDASAFCTGSILNDSRQSFRSFLLSANHCQIGVNTLVRFKYQSPNCTPTSAPAQVVTMNGVDILSSYGGSDVALRELKQQIPANASGTYLGWNRASGNVSNSFGIHHPSGDVKKISFTNADTEIATYGGASCLHAYWNDKGVTEPGSSGSPLFDGNRRVVGQLYGGPSTCSATGANRSDYYGRFFTSWTGGGTASTRLSNWLDPTNVGNITTNSVKPIVDGQNVVTNSGSFSLNAGTSSIVSWSVAGPTSAISTTSGTGNVANIVAVSNANSLTITFSVNAGQSYPIQFSREFNVVIPCALSASLSASSPLSCSATSVTLTASGGSSGDTYAFSNGAIQIGGSTGNTATVNSPGLYSVTVTSSGGCSNTASVEVTQTSTVASVSITPSSATLSCATSSVSLSATGTGTYRWSTGDITQTISVTAANTYSVTLTTGSGCTATASAQVLQDNTVPTVSISPSSTTLTCTTSSVSLSATGTGTYLWNTGATTPSISATAAGTYTVTLTTGNNCTATASAQVIQGNSVPIVGISPTSATLSCATSSVSLSATGTGTYLWNTGATTSVISATAAGNYSVTLTGSNGCTATTSAQVFQDNMVPTVSISPTSATLSCATSSVSLSAVGTGTYLWNTGATTSSISATAAGNYSVTLTSGNGCTTTTSAQVVQDNSVPMVSISPTSATLSCATSSVSLSATGTGTYLWNTGATTSSISATAAGNYSVTLTSGNGCTTTTSAQVVQDSSVPTVTITANPSLTIGAGQSATLTASGATTYLWSTGSGTNPIVVNTPGVVSVTGTTGGCQGVASITVVQTSPAGPFSITSVTTNNCQQISANRYVIDFTPQYVGTNGQPISFSVVNELFPTTAPGPYTLQLYTDNPVITLKAQQGSTPGEASYSYNWLAACSNPMPNTPPRVNQPLSNQIAKVGEAFGYTIPQTTFTDNESPNSLVLSVSGLPAGLNFTQPNQIGGVPSLIGVSSVTVTATDPQGLSAISIFSLSVIAPSTANTPPTVANPPGNFKGYQGEPFNLSVSAVFTDAQTPNSLTLTSSVLPAGLTLANGVISGTPSQTGATTVTLTATDPGGLSASTDFLISILSPPVTGSFTITSVTTNNCQQISANRYAISFTPVYSGTNGQPISFSVVNELFPTTEPGPYSLQLYNDNPVIVLKAKQNNTPSEVSYSYNWLAACSNPMPNTAPRVNQPLTNQVAVVGQGFGYTIPQNTFTDNETPNSLVLSVSGLPAGLNFTQPNQIGGVPSLTGVSNVTVTATDPQGLSVSATFSLTVNPANAPSGFFISGVQTLSCVTISANRRSITFNPQYNGLNGNPVSFSVVNEMLPTTASGPYQLQLYTDNATIQLRAQQGNAQTSYAYNWLAACNASTRSGIAEEGTGLMVTVLENPVTGHSAQVEIRGVAGQRVQLGLVDTQGRLLHQNVIEQAGAVEQVSVPLNTRQNVLILQVRSENQVKTVKIIKP